MQRLLTREEMYELDSYLVNEIGIPESSLMESAALSSVNIINELYTNEKKVLVICGTGNNGGDGLSIAKYLNTSKKVDFAIFGEKSRLNALTKKNYEINKLLGVNELDINNINFDDYDIIIDSILGIGSNGIIKGELKDLVKNVNCSSATKISIDIPTGINPYTGIVENDCIKADHTITMYAYKTGLFLNSAKDFSATIHKVNLGVPDHIIHKFSKINLFTQNKVISKTNNSSKFDYGKILVIAGSSDMPGAGSLASNSAICSGAGLVYLVSTGKDNNLYSEVIPISENLYKSHIDNNEEIIPYINNIDSVIIGPGLGKNEKTKNLLLDILNRYQKANIIIDADALNFVSIDKKYSKNIILTPHIVEFSRIIGKSTEEIQRDIPKYVKETAKIMNVNILLKGPTTVISDGEEVIFVSNGIPNMATAGTGDVLSGILGAYLHFDLFDTKIENIANSVYIHNKASVLASSQKNTIIASDIYKAVQCLK